MAKLEIIVGSTRPGRVALPIGQWFESVAVAHGGFTEVELVDLAEVNLPFMDEPDHPRLAQYTQQHTRDWSAKVAEADAFVFVSPEYNSGFSAPLKNAIDYLHNEWAYKPVGQVGYGGVGGGIRAAQMIKQVVNTVRMVPVPDAVTIPFVAQFIDEEKNFVPNDVINASAKTMLDELVRVSETLRPLREGAGSETK